MKYFFIFLIICFVIISINKSQNKNVKIEPINLNKNHICASDDMIIINYNGPKAQIIWKDGSRSFYCEVREAFYESSDKIKKKFILAFYVQDFSNVEWGSYTDKWITAQNAFYVIDSLAIGAMGLSYVPFSNEEEAKIFIKKYNGKLLTFDKINNETLIKSSEILEKNEFYKT